jgi:hypothetical protein
MAYSLNVINMNDECAGNGSSAHSHYKEFGRCVAKVIQCN